MCLINKRFSLRSITVNNDSDIINAGFKCFSEFDEADDLIPHFVICTNYFANSGHEKTFFKEIFWLKMRENGVRSVILTILGANIFKMTNVPSSRYQKSDKTIGFCDIDLVRKSYWMSKKSSFFTIFSMTKIEN